MKTDIYSWCVSKKREFLCITKMSRLVASFGGYDASLVQVRSRASLIFHRQCALCDHQTRDFPIPGLWKQNPFFFQVY